jgi:ribosome recycling factor
MDDLYLISLDAEDKMQKAVVFLLAEFSGLNTGKATPAMVDKITVDYYGSPTRLQQLGSISIPEPRLLVITPFDPSTLPDIQKAILAANIGVTPMNDGRVIRVPVPELSGERRREMAKIASRNAEEQRVAIRNVRRDANEAVKAMEKAGDITEDDRKTAMDEIQKLTDSFVKKIDEALAVKEKEILAE